MQLDDAARGFSFQHDGPLDMRMSASGETAADFVNGAEEEEIANVIYAFGEERKSRAIARAIVKRRAETPFTRTLELADVVARVFHGRKVDGRHPATRTFQALRIFVNDELGELASGLSLPSASSNPADASSSSRFTVSKTGSSKSSWPNDRERPRRFRAIFRKQSIKSEPPSFRLVNSRPLTPSKGELDVNPRARSARLRAAIRTDAAPWPPDVETFGVPRPKS